MDPKPSFEQLWKDAEDRFLDRTKKNLRSPGSRRTLDDVINEIRTKFEDECSKDHSQKKHELLVNVQNVLTCVQMLCGVAAFAVSQVGFPFALSSTAKNSNLGLWRGKFLLQCSLVPLQHTR